MDRLKLILLLAAAGRVQVTRLARDLGVSRDWVYQVLIWRKSPFTSEHAEMILALLGLERSDLGGIVGGLTDAQIRDAFEVFKLGGIERAELEAAMGADDLDRAISARVVEDDNGRLKLVRRR